MKAEFKWHVVTVPGHQLEDKLNEMTHDQYEIVQVERSDSDWTIIARRSVLNEPKGQVIGFTAQKE